MFGTFNPGEMTPDEMTMYAIKAQAFKELRELSDKLEEEEDDRLQQGES